MMSLQFRLAGWSLPAVAVLLLGAAEARAQVPAPPGGDQPEDRVRALLDEADLVYTKVDQGLYKVIMSPDAQSTKAVAVLVQERRPWGDMAPGVVNFLTFAVDAPDGFTPPPSMLKKAVELNDFLVVGKLTMSGGGDVYYFSNLWLDGATGEKVQLECVLAYYNTLSAQEALTPFVEQ